MRRRRESAARRITLLMLAALCAAAWASPPPLPAALQAEQQARAGRLQAMTPAQRNQLEQRLVAWDALSTSERDDRRARYQAWRALTAGERTELARVATELAAFPPERAQALRTQFDLLDASVQRGWRLGPALGADYDRLQPLLAYVAPGQRQPLLAALRQMDPQQRADLAVLAQRTSPQARQELRDALLGTPQQQRATWLREQVGP